MNLLVLIPARSGSKGLPGKNTAILGDLPLLAWSAAAVRRANPAHSRLILSTDDPHTAQIGRDHGLEVPFLRPAHLAGDTVGLEDVTAHLLEHLTQTGDQPDAVLLLQPTSPFRRPETITQALDLLEANPQVQGILGVKALHRSPALMFRADAAMDLTPLERKRISGHRRQEVQPYYTPDGTLFLVRTRAFLEQHSYYPDHCRGVPTQAIEQLDIDTPADWELAQAVVNAGLTWRGALTPSRP